MRTRKINLKKIKPGIYQGITNAQYHGEISAVSNSYLGRLEKCPANAKVPQTDTPAMLIGRACHAYVLEGQGAFAKEYVVLPASVNLKTNAGKEEKAQLEKHHPGKAIITEADYDMIRAMRDAVHAHPFAAKLIAEGISEQTVIWKDEGNGILCKCRPDRIPAGDKGTIVDFKTTDNADGRAFSRSVLSYGYARQAAFYSDGTAATTGKMFDSFAFIATEKKPPFRTEVYVLDDEWLTWGRNEYVRLLQIEAECRERGHYPHYQNAGAEELYKPMYV